MIFRNHSNMLICCSRNISDCLKQLCWFKVLWKPKWILMNWNRILCNIVKFFTFTLDHFKAFLLNEISNFFTKKHLTNPKVLKSNPWIKGWLSLFVILQMSFHGACLYLFLCACVCLLYVPAQEPWVLKFWNSIKNLYVFFASRLHKLAYKLVLT